MYAEMFTQLLLLVVAVSASLDSIGLDAFNAIENNRKEEITRGTNRITALSLSYQRRRKSKKFIFLIIIMKKIVFSSLDSLW
jgi:hypothetical protein